MRGDVCRVSGVGKRFSLIQGLFLAGVLAAGLLLSGCGGSPEEKASVEEPTEEETNEATTEKTTESANQQETTTRSKEQAVVEMEVDAAPPSSSPQVSCESFTTMSGSPSQWQAQQFLDFVATPEQRAILDPEGDGFACSVGNPRPPTTPKQTTPPVVPDNTRQSSAPDGQADWIKEQAKANGCYPSCQGAALAKMTPDEREAIGAVRDMPPYEGR
jgi:hypothetical protein